MSAILDPCRNLTILAIDTPVAPNDVFPEQFEHFIVGKRKFKDILKSLHGDLMPLNIGTKFRKNVHEAMFNTSRLTTPACVLTEAN